ncbi:MAG: hypothetical protein QF652_02635 [Dehalococcoidia bacterium]|jgi:hypothetical protein|nr:hypothetical protein [Dehalococcoidia bacterium]
MGEKHKPYVRVTLEGPDDGGDFGPHTPGTKTAGIQEALDYAHENCRDVYIFGGRGGRHDRKAVTPGNVYHLEETLRVPWSHQFRLDGGNYILWYPKPTGHAIVIDSQDNCSYRFGMIVSESEGAAVCIKPQTAGPDDCVVVVCSLFEFAGVCSYTTGSEGVGILIDASDGPILRNRIFSAETMTHTTGLHIVDDGAGKGSVTANEFNVLCTDQRRATGTAVGMRIGDPGSNKIQENWFRGSFHAPQGVYLDESGEYISPPGFVAPEGAIALDIFAQNNLFECAFFGTRASGMDLVFEADSRDNTVRTFGLPNGMTNKATVPTNRVVSNPAAGVDVLTPPVPRPGEDLLNTTCQTVEVFVLHSGDVSEWKICDARGSSRTFSAGLLVGQSFVLDPGDGVRFEYDTPPTWDWKALR